MKHLNLFFSILIMTFASITYAQNYDDCFNTKEIHKSISSCKSLLNDKNTSNRDSSIAAMRIGLLLSLINLGDSNEIIGYYLIAADKGNTNAYSLIGEIYRTGYKELKPDFNKALHYYYLDTDGGFIKTRGLGEMYLKGNGVELSVDTAINLFTFATEFNREDSQTRMTLCEIYSVEKYGKIDLRLAYFWCSSAVKAESFPQLKSFYEETKMKIHARMTENQLTESERLIKKCSQEKITSICLLINN